MADAVEATHGTVLVEMTKDELRAVYAALMVQDHDAETDVFLGYDWKHPGPYIAYDLAESIRDAAHS